MTRALIVEDDPRIRETVADVVESLGHEHDTASCQDAARQLLNGNPYSYALLDLEIPVRQDRGFVRIENGINLLREVISQCGKQTPVIVMTAHGNDGPFQSVDCMKLGAADYIPKPFPIRGRTLDKAILEALERSGQAGRKASVVPKPYGPPRPFRVVASSNPRCQRFRSSSHVECPMPAHEISQPNRVLQNSQQFGKSPAARPESLPSEFGKIYDQNSGRDTKPAGPHRTRDSNAEV